MHRGIQGKGRPKGDRRRRYLSAAHQACGAMFGEKNTAHDVLIGRPEGNEFGVDFFRGDFEGNSVQGCGNVHGDRAALSFSRGEFDGGMDLCPPDITLGYGGICRQAGNQGSALHLLQLMPCVYCMSIIIRLQKAVECGRAHIAYGRSVML